MPISDKHFDPNKSFFTLKIVKVTIYGIIVLSLASFFTITITSNLSIDWTSKGFNTFLSVYRFPLGILALSIPIIAIYATNHRSIQQKEQITLAYNQNNFTNYYKHLEEFEKYYLKNIPSDMAPTEQRPGIDVSHYHKLFYKDSRFGDFTVDKDFYDKQYQSLIKIIDQLCKVDVVNSPEEKFNIYIIAVNEIRNFCGALYLFYIGGVSRQDMASDNTIHPVIEAFSALQIAIYLFVKISDFSINPSYSRYFPMITILDLQGIKDTYIGENKFIGTLGFKSALERLDMSYHRPEDSKSVSDYRNEFIYFQPSSRK